MDEDILESRRRGRRRAILGGSAISDSTVTEGGYGNSDINMRVEDMVATTNTRLSEVQDRATEEESNRDFTPHDRMDDVRKRASSYEREYRLKLVHRMLMRNIPLDQIAGELQVSVQTIQRDRNELLKRLRTAAQELDINQYIGDTLGFYGEVQGMSLRAASVSKLPMNVRLAAMRTALASKNDQHRFLNAVGVFDVLRFRASETGESDDLEKLVAMTEAILNDKNVEDNLKSVAFDEMEFVEEERVHII